MWAHLLLAGERRSEDIEQGARCGEHWPHLGEGRVRVRSKLREGVSVRVRVSIRAKAGKQLSTMTSKLSTERPLACEVLLYGGDIPMSVRTGHQ